jgi:hypothetical protein
MLDILSTHHNRLAAEDYTRLLIAEIVRPFITSAEQGAGQHAPDDSGERLAYQCSRRNTIRSIPYFNLDEAPHTNGGVPKP